MRGLVCQPGSIPRLKHETICKSGDLFLFPPHPLQVLPSDQDAQVQSCMFREVIKLSQTTSSLWNGNGTAYLGVVTGYFCFFLVGAGVTWLVGPWLKEAGEGTQSRNLAGEDIEECYLLACSACSLTQPRLICPGGALPSSLDPPTSVINQENAPTGQGDRDIFWIEPLGF